MEVARTYKLQAADKFMSTKYQQDQQQATLLHCCRSTEYITGFEDKLPNKSIRVLEGGYIYLYDSQKYKLVAVHHYNNGTLNMTPATLHMLLVSPLFLLHHQFTLALCPSLYSFLNGRYIVVHLSSLSFSLMLITKLPLNLHTYNFAPQIALKYQIQHF